MIEDKTGLEEESKKLAPNEISLTIPCCEGGELKIIQKTQDLQYTTDILKRMFAHVGVSMNLATTRKGGGGP